MSPGWTIIPCGRPIAATSFICRSGKPRLLYWNGRQQHWFGDPAVQKPHTLHRKVLGCCSSLSFRRPCPPNGRWVVASQWFGGSSVVWLIPHLRDGAPIRFTEGSDATVSPDGRWLLYA